MSAPFAAHLLAGVPADRVRAILERAGGNEIASGKFASPESSAALAVNGFGSFLDRPAELPPVPPLADLDWPATRVDGERQMRFAWSGGSNPWRDAAAETAGHPVGVDSKRYDRYRDAKQANLSDAYDRDVWGEGMGAWFAMRDHLRAQSRNYRHLAAAQLVKRVLGVVTEERRIGKAPVMLYLFAMWTTGRVIAPKSLVRHREKISRFAAAVSGNSVRFAACSWREWLGAFEGKVYLHVDRMLERYAP